MQLDPSIYSHFCMTSIVPPATEQAYPLTLSQYITSPPALPAPAPMHPARIKNHHHQNENPQQPLLLTPMLLTLVKRTNHRPNINGVLVLRAMLGDPADAAAFYETHTTIAPMPVYSRWSRYKGLSPPPIIPPTCTDPLPARVQYSGLDASYSDGDGCFLYFDYSDHVLAL
ncbi:hypothetical protein Dda_1270 [Drechslerella dactyloides]|uniref:Uncharacterized protein n=1 Tax=Drechslerella dactyloides TaxID=74499 RepID=A0AAD6J348_DREDA|nr:hypothetical protein Dda_1270 [Drechslerella dactyloides]